MRIERDDRGRPAQLARTFDDAADDRLMADMQSVEITDRGHAPPRQIGLLQRVMQYEHWA